jgi:hypothetical protein
MITESRRWIGWLRDSADPDLMSIPVAMLFMSRACFAMAWSDQDDLLYPRRTLNALLGAYDSSAWQSQHDVELPDWLT